MSKRFFSSLRSSKKIAHGRDVCLLREVCGAVSRVSTPSRSSQARILAPVAAAALAAGGKGCRRSLRVEDGSAAPRLLRFRLNPQGTPPRKPERQPGDTSATSLLLAPLGRMQARIRLPRPWPSMSSLFKWPRAAESAGAQRAFLPPFPSFPASSKAVLLGSRTARGVLLAAPGLGALDSGLWQIAFEQLNLNHPNFCNCYSSPPFQFSSLSSPLHQADYTFLQHAPPRKQTDGSSKSSFLDFVWVLVISLVSLFKKHCLNGLKQTFWFGSRPCFLLTALPATHPLPSWLLHAEHLQVPEVHCPISSFQAFVQLHSLEFFTPLPHSFTWLTSPIHNLFLTLLPLWPLHIPTLIDHGPPSN